MNHSPKNNGAPTLRTALVALVSGVVLVLGAGAGQAAPSHTSTQHMSASPHDSTW